AWTGTVLVVGGVATFLLAASPSGGHPDPGTGSWVLMVLPCAAVAGGAVVLAGRRPRRRASLLAVAAGVSFGLLSVFTKNLTYLIGSDGLGFAAHWQPYALAGLGAGGFLFSQSAYQAGPLGSSLPVIDALEPTVAVVLAAAGFGEHLGHSGLAIVLEALGAAAAIAGVSLVGRSPLVVDLYGAPAPAGCPAGGPGAGGALG
ncbi:MAG: DMT family transporter, partial [Acidimicrobiales bacterium]